MARITHFPHLEPAHSWRMRVTLAETLPKQDTNMWGRTVEGEYVHCIKHEECEECGATREDINCLCEKDVGDRCAIRLAWLNEQKPV